MDAEVTNVPDGNEGSIKPFMLGRNSSEVFCVASYNRHHNNVCVCKDQVYNQNFAY